MLNDLDMGKLATAHSLSDYPKMTITSVKHRLGQHAKAIRLDYSFRGKSYGYDVGITTSSCHYGNYRYWFNCPNCNKRVGVLYCAGVYVCRHCIGANYATQLMQPIDKLFRKVAKIRHRLGWPQGIANGHGSRPKGMHRKTYDRLVSEHDRIADHLLGLELEWVSKLQTKVSKAG